MQDYLYTDRLVLSRYLPVEKESDGSESFYKKYKSSPYRLRKFIEKNQRVIGHIFGWWVDVLSEYTAAKHIIYDARLWEKKKQLQYYIFEKDKQECIGIVSVPIEKNEGYILLWLIPTAQNKKYAAEVYKAVEKELFLSLGVEKTVCECFKRNSNYAKVCNFMTHMGEFEVEEKTFSIRWVKTKQQYFKECGIVEKIAERPRFNLLRFLRRERIRDKE